MMFDLGIATITERGVWLRVAFRDGTLASFTQGLVDATGWYRVQAAWGVIEEGPVIWAPAL